MNALRFVLLPLLATGLLAAPGVRQSGRAYDEPTPTWRSAQHGPEAVVLDSRAEALSARPPDERVPDTASDGNASPDSAASAQRWGHSERGEARGLSARTADERLTLAQSHRRVNGSANAHGARA